MAVDRKKDPLLALAVLKLNQRLGRVEQSPDFRDIYEGLLRDWKLTDAQVEAYLEQNYDRVAARIGAAGRDGK